MYSVIFYQGDYRQRQKKANADNCIAYVEHHFNSCDDPNAGYALAITSRNANKLAERWGRWYARKVAKSFRIPMGGKNGILIGGYRGRGNNNIKYCHMPAVLLEPLFASNPQQAKWIRSEAGQDKLASILAESIRQFFPEGGKIGFSIGHKYKTSRPKDRGAAVFGGGTEADYAEKILLQTAALLLKEKKEKSSKYVGKELDKVFSKLEEAIEKTKTIQVNIDSLDKADFLWESSELLMGLADAYVALTNVKSLVLSIYQRP